MADIASTPEGAPVGRRVVLGMIGLGALGIVWGKKATHVVNKALNPITSRDPTGLSDLIPGADEWRIYAELGSPNKSDAEYRLQVDGLVDHPVTYTLADLRTTLPQTMLTKDFQCVTGWRVPKVHWQGVRLSEILDRAGVKTTGAVVKFYSFDEGYTETLTMEQARRADVIVAHQMLGKPVTQQHGGPVRLYVAPMYGYKSAKWLSRIEVITSGGLPGYWEQNGYDTDAWIGQSNGRSDPPVN